ncbi:hypothetical protein EON64_19530, partial [archaeon]
MPLLLNLPLPPWEEAVKLSPSFQSVQLVVFFQANKEVMTTSLLRVIFSAIGEVEVHIKHSEYDPVIASRICLLCFLNTTPSYCILHYNLSRFLQHYGVQHGYGFLHFKRSWAGIQQALLAPSVFKHRNLNGIL